MNIKSYKNNYEQVKLKNNNKLQVCRPQPRGEKCKEYFWLTFFFPSSLVLIGG